MLREYGRESSPLLRQEGDRGSYENGDATNLSSYVFNVWIPDYILGNDKK